MSKKIDLFCDIPCLTETPKLFSGIELHKKWFKSADKRFMGQYIQKFIDYNNKLFQFIGVKPHITGSDKNTSLSLTTSNFIGTIPLKAPDTGKQIGDLVVLPRFEGCNKFEEYIEILNLLKEEINAEFTDSIPLASDRNFRPPMYLDSIKFIDSLEILVSKGWRKFEQIEKLSIQPKGQINWNKYIEKSYKTENILKFPIKNNIISEFHREYSEIRYVFDICKKEILSGNTPQTIKYTHGKKINTLEERLYNHKPKETNNIKIRFSDTPIIKSCKEKANIILDSKKSVSTAWRVDFSFVYEKFIQYIFKEVAIEKGGRFYPNLKIRSRKSKRYTWEVKHLEPDGIYQKGDIIIFIDAKYKSNLYNKSSESINLKEDHRRDIHQIMAYLSFSVTKIKFGFICYPSKEIEIKEIRYYNNINGAENNIKIIGIPFNKKGITIAKSLISKEIDKIEKERC